MAIVRSERPVFTHGDWVQIYVDRDPESDGPGFVRIDEQYGAPGVAVLPIRDRSIGLCMLDRHNLQRTVLEVPRGFGDKGGGPRSDAVRELEEETGIRVTQAELIELGTVVPNSGLLSSEVELYAVLVEDETHIGEIQDVREVQSFDWYPLPDVYRWIATGELNDAFTHSALLRAALQGLVPAAGGTA